MNSQEYRDWAGRMAQAGFAAYGVEHNARMTEAAENDNALRGVMLVRVGFTWHLMEGETSIASSGFATPEARNALFLYAKDNQLVIFEEVKS